MLSSKRIKHNLIYTTYSERSASVVPESDVFYVKSQTLNLSSTIHHYGHCRCHCHCPRLSWPALVLQDPSMVVPAGAARLVADSLARSWLQRQCFALQRISSRFQSGPPASSLTQVCVFVCVNGLGVVGVGMDCGVAAIQDRRFSSWHSLSSHLYNQDFKLIRIASLITPLSRGHLQPSRITA